MASSPQPVVSPIEEGLSAFQAVRSRTVALAEGLSDADLTVQSMDDASPGKWHLAHTTWFFEEFVLAQRSGFQRFDPDFAYLFNSYYESVGKRQPRARRGLLSRPSIERVLAYRQGTDAALSSAWDELGNRERQLVELGCHHEQQHQELFLTDLLHFFSEHPLRPAYRPMAARMVDARPTSGANFIGFEGGLTEIGDSGQRFSFDCERPRHAVFLQPFAIASRLVTNGEWMAFMDAGGYADPQWWLADGFARAASSGWNAPGYWRRTSDGWVQMTLHGEVPVMDDAPVTHVSFYEADAFARFSGARLPTEAEWEHAAAGERGQAGDAIRDYLPRPCAQGDGLCGLYGQCWQWTASPYIAYPGFRTAPGAVGEYNGKFMSGQFVLRGSSVATPKGHTRPTYRNFFYPHQRWQFTGLRLAKDIQ